jgi:hypothetical protein
MIFQNEGVPGLHCFVEKLDQLGKVRHLLRHFTCRSDREREL